VWDRSQQLLALLDDVVDAALPGLGFRPLRPPMRGGHLALRHPSALAESLSLRGRRVVVDYRPPDILRLCPSPLTTRFVDVVELVRALSLAADVPPETVTAPSVV
jgi:kynureninase